MSVLQGNAADLPHFLRLGPEILRHIETVVSCAEV
jgi:hypothetical protein